MKKIIPHKLDKNIILRDALVFSGIVVNVLLYFLMYGLKLPLFLDATGTIFVTLIAGPYFGILTAVVTNFISLAFDSTTMYFSAINAIIAIQTSAFSRKHSFKKTRDIFGFIIAMAMISGVFSVFIRRFIGMDPALSGVDTAAAEFSESTGFPYLMAALILDVLLNVFDKGISLGIALLVIHFLPDDTSARIATSTVKQRLLSEEEEKSIFKWRRGSISSLRLRESSKLLFTSLVLVIAMAWIGLQLYFNAAKNDRIEAANDAVRFAAEVVDATKIDTYLMEGESAPGYRDTKDMLYKIRNNSLGVDYLYLMKVAEDGCYIIFDLDTETEYGYDVGTRLDYKEAMLPYKEALLAGQLIEPIESRDKYGWLLTVSYPLRNAFGETVCYIVCEVSLEYMADYMFDFVIRILLVMAGLFMLIVAFELWSTSIYTTYPLGAMTACVEQFTAAGDDQVSLDENVRKIRSLDIHTGDEIEKLYNTICDMTLNQAEQMRSIRHLSESTMQMQEGLIITMADMVESRDSDTGAHVQKTAAYVKIIVEGLQRKGYYAEKITPKFISDIVRSAPLHDVGKINIPDGILNKPGKLTDEEFEIMKTHTTAGKEIIEKAISTVKGGSYLKEARNMAAYHHERWDGKGYPEGLHGEVIPLSARIMAVADVFDALVSPRVYKPAFPIEKAIEIIQDGAGKQFDAKCVEVFLDSLPEVRVIMKKYDHI